MSSYHLPEEIADRPNRKSMRMKGWDYSSPGVYYITICTRGHACWFGSINNNSMALASVGQIAHQYWIDIPKHFSFVQLDGFIVMPNHLHGIIIIKPSSIGTHDFGMYNDASVGTRDLASLRKTSLQNAPLQRCKTNKFGPLTPKSLQSIIHAYKSSVTKWCRKNGFDDFGWQRRFYEHKIRSKQELWRIRKYIVQNPRNWNEEDLEGHVMLA